MTLSDFHHITDELLSAYIDDEVTEQERTLVEAAIVQDEQIAWRLNSLRQTVTLLRELPEMPLPRTFTLTVEHTPAAHSVEQATLGGVVAVDRAPHAPVASHTAGFWNRLADGWQSFWQGGNPILRNAAAVSFAVLLLLTSGAPMLTRTLTQPAGSTAAMMKGAPEAAPAAAMSDETVPAAESLARAPTASPTHVPDATTAVAMAEAEDSAAESTLAQDAPAAGDASPAVEAGEAAVAAASAAESDTAAARAPTEEVAVAAAMAAPNTQSITSGESVTEESIEPPLIAMQPPIPGGGQGHGGGGGDGTGDIGGVGAADPSGLLPEQAYGFDIDPAPPAEEAVSASVAALPATEAPAQAVASMEGTPAVDAPVAAAAARTSAQEATVDVASADIATSDVATGTEPVAESAAAVDVPTVEEAEAAISNQAAPTRELVTTPTPEAVALVGPTPITSSDVVENVSTEGAIDATSPAANLPVLWIAQGATLLLTVMLASLWWRSRTPRRPR